jgi:hypothetical protein
LQETGGRGKEEREFAVLAPRLASPHLPRAL